jgi:hypothetical protein
MHAATTTNGAASTCLPILDDRPAPTPDQNISIRSFRFNLRYEQSADVPSYNRATNELLFGLDGGGGGGGTAASAMPMRRRVAVSSRSSGKKAHVQVPKERQQDGEEDANDNVVKPDTNGNLTPPEQVPKRGDDNDDGMDVSDDENHEGVVVEEEAATASSDSRIEKLPMAPPPAKRPRLSKQRCFNCGSYGHSLRECWKEIDAAAVENGRQSGPSGGFARSRSKHFSFQRYFTEGDEEDDEGGGGGEGGRRRAKARLEEEFPDVKPGKLSATLLRALDLDELDPPPWLHAMQALGLPPAYSAPSREESLEAREVGASGAAGKLNTHTEGANKKPTMTTAVDAAIGNVEKDDDDDDDDGDGSEVARARSSPKEDGELSPMLSPSPQQKESSPSGGVLPDDGVDASNNHKAHNTQDIDGEEQGAAVNEIHGDETGSEGEDAGAALMDETQDFIGFDLLDDEEDIETDASPNAAAAAVAAVKVPPPKDVAPRLYVEFPGVNVPIPSGADARRWSNRVSEIERCWHERRPGSRSSNKHTPPSYYHHSPWDAQRSVGGTISTTTGGGGGGGGGGGTQYPYHAYPPPPSYHHHHQSYPSSAQRAAREVPPGEGSSVAPMLPADKLQDLVQQLTFPGGEGNADTGGHATASYQQPYQYHQQQYAVDYHSSWQQSAPPPPPPAAAAAGPSAGAPLQHQQGSYYGVEYGGYAPGISGGGEGQQQQQQRESWYDQAYPSHQHQYSPGATPYPNEHVQHGWQTHGQQQPREDRPPPPPPLPSQYHYSHQQHQNYQVEAYHRERNDAYAEPPPPTSAECSNPNSTRPSWYARR